ncbi:MAG: cobalamin-binding protein [Gammaproteobacteria bacterium]|nr:cobalamin-binding protein [Gammaproteobacteria bacterium]MYH32179.1 cobalamin-binding protein [Gammaproteobacteria bacterium]
MGEQRIVSLIASATEIVAALGFEKQLVGRSHECDYPPAIAGVPVCSASKIDAQASSRQIDAQVKALVDQALSVYRVDAELLDRLAPDLIITQSQCEVCAVSLADVQQAVGELVSSRPEVVSLEPMDLDDVWEDIRRVAGALEDDGSGEQLVDRLTARLGDVATRAKRRAEQPSIACIEWIDPLMFAANWVPALVEIAGGRIMKGEAGRHSGYFDFDELASSDPDVLAVMPCGFDIEQSLKEMPALTGRSGWSRLSAVRNGRVFVTDGNQYFNRPGPRLVESAEILAELLHPGAFDFGHQGTGWMRWSESAA